uniref:Si:dkey-6i22.5 n=1 Tax=Nothobranchius furzeri TaxID=105023 RepID=A0A8C6NK97_NOTFU
MQTSSACPSPKQSTQDGAQSRSLIILFVKTASVELCLGNMSWVILLFCLSFKGFASMFHPLYKKNPQMMESIHKQFTEELQKTIQEDITRLMEEGMLEYKLNELDKLENAAKDSPESVWRPSGDPEQDLCSFLMPYYQKQEAYVKLELKKIRAENAALAEQVQAGREGIAQTEQHISTAVEEWRVWKKSYRKIDHNANIEVTSKCISKVFVILGCVFFLSFLFRLHWQNLNGWLLVSTLLMYLMCDF